MKARLLPPLLLVALFVILPAGRGQQPTLADALKASILRTEETRLYAMRQPDTAALDDLLTDDCLYVHSTGGTQTKAQLLAALGDGSLRYTELRLLAPPAVRLFGSGTAVLTAQVHLEGEQKGRGRISTNLTYTCVYVELEARWRLASYQSTTLPPAPPAPK
jgi:uncharacterized protein (TIGR02246 family)